MRRLPPLRPPAKAWVAGQKSGQAIVSACPESTHKHHKTTKTARVSAQFPADHAIRCERDWLLAAPRVPFVPALWKELTQEAVSSEPLATPAFNLVSECVRMYIVNEYLFHPSNPLLVPQPSALVIIVPGSVRTDCQHHAANQLRPRRQVINESHQLRRQNHSSAVFIPAETHRWQMLYSSLCRFLMAAKAVAICR